MAPTAEDSVVADAELSPALRVKIKWFMDRILQAFTKDVGESVRLICGHSVTSAVLKELPRAALIWTFNEMPLVMDASRFLYYKGNLDITDLTPGDTGVYQCLVQWGANPALNNVTLGVYSLQVKTESPTRYVFAEEAVRFQCHSGTLGRLFPAATRQWLYNGSVADIPMATLANDRRADVVGRVAKSMAGVWECQVVESKTDRAWKTAWLKIGVQAPPSEASKLYLQMVSHSAAIVVVISIIVVVLLVLFVLACFKMKTKEDETEQEFIKQRNGWEETLSKLGDDGRINVDGVGEAAASKAQGLGLDSGDAEGEGLQGDLGGDVTVEEDSDDDEEEEDDDGEMNYNTSENEESSDESGSGDTKRWLTAGGKISIKEGNTSTEIDSQVLDDADVVRVSSQDEYSGKLGDVKSDDITDFGDNTSGKYDRKLYGEKLGTEADIDRIEKNINRSRYFRTESRRQNKNSRINNQSNSQEHRRRGRRKCPRAWEKMRNNAFPPRRLLNFAHAYTWLLETSAHLRQLDALLEDEKSTALPEQEDIASTTSHNIFSRPEYHPDLITEACSVPPDLRLSTYDPMTGSERTLYPTCQSMIGSHTINENFSRGNLRIFQAGNEDIQYRTEVRPYSINMVPLVECGCTCPRQSHTQNLNEEHFTKGSHSSENNVRSQETSKTTRKTLRQLLKSWKSWFAKKAKSVSIQSKSSGANWQHSQVRYSVLPQADSFEDTEV